MPFHCVRRGSGADTGSRNGGLKCCWTIPPYRQTRVHRQIDQMWAEKLSGQDDTEDMER